MQIHIYILFNIYSSEESQWMFTETFYRNEQKRNVSCHGHNLEYTAVIFTYTWEVIRIDSKLSVNSGCNIWKWIISFLNSSPKQPLSNRSWAT